MKARELSWLGTRSDEFEATNRFFREVMGLETVLQEPGFAVYKLPSGDTVEVFGPESTYNSYFDTGPVAGFLVEDVEEARTEMEAAGVEFIGPVQRSDDGDSWSHFRGPDGNFYELTGERS